MTSRNKEASVVRITGGLFNGQVGFLQGKTITTESGVVVHSRKQEYDSLFSLNLTSKIALKRKAIKKKRERAKEIERGKGKLKVFLDFWF